MPTAIGIGCFLFLYTGDEDKFDPAAHLDTIVKCLNRVDAVSKVNVRSTTDVYEIIPPPGATHEGMLPLYCDLDLSFDIFLPRRVQEQFLVGNGESRAHAEHFSVAVVQEFEFPVVFISYEVPLAHIGHDSPSDAVQFVREYLKTKLSGMDDLLAFDVLGPSPLHARSLSR